MPVDIKKAVLALILSCVSTLIAVYFDGLDHAAISFGSPLTIGLNIVWTLVIAWIIWDLCRGKDIKPTLILVGLVMLASLAWDLIEYGFGMARLFYGFELAMFVAAYLAVSSTQSKAWQRAKAG